MKTPEWVEDLLHLFFPVLCPGCQIPLPSSTHPLCHRCRLVLPSTGFEELCDNALEKIFWGKLSLIGAAAAFYFTKSGVLQHVVHAIKYRSSKPLATYMGRMMGNMLRDSSRFSRTDVLLPLPLHPARLRERGFNQAGLLAEGMSEIMEVPVLHTALRRVSATLTQTTKRRGDRWSNVSHAFEAVQPDLLLGKNILLVDDVITTGATITACGAAIRRALPEARLSVYALAFADR